MFCPNCGNIIEEKDCFCQNCGIRLEKPINHSEVKSPAVKKQPDKQIFRIIVLIIMTVSLFANAYLLWLYSKIEFEAISTLLTENETFLVLNIVLLFLPVAVMFLVKSIGWILFIFADFLCIIITALTLIKARGKKIIWAILLIVLFIVLTVLASLTIPK